MQYSLFPISREKYRRKLNSANSVSTEPQNLKESEDSGPPEPGRATPKEAEAEAYEETVEMLVEHATIPEGPTEAYSAEADPKPWVANPKSKTRNSSTTRLRSKSPVWDVIRRLNDDHPKSKKGFTQVCTQTCCSQFLKVTKAKDSTSWPTTRAGKRLRNSNSEDGRNSLQEGLCRSNRGLRGCGTAQYTIADRDRDSGLPNGDRKTLKKWQKMSTSPELEESLLRRPINSLLTKL